MSVHYNLCLLSSSDTSSSVFRVAGITGMQRHYAALIFVFLVEMWFLHVGQAGLELLTSGDQPALASQSVGMTGVRHHAQLKYTISYLFIFFFLLLSQHNLLPLPQ